MKKLVLATTLAVVALGATAANARVNLDIGIGVPAYEPVPVYAAPYYEPAPAYYGPPVYYPSYYNGRDRHRNYDWRYWHDHDHDHDHDHHDPHGHH